MKLHNKSDRKRRIKELHIAMLLIACTFPYWYPIHRIKL